MSKKIILFLTILFVSLSYSQEFSERNASIEFEVRPNTATKIEILNIDSLIIHTIFDNILERTAKVYVVKQPTFFKMINESKNDVYIPMPILNDGKYFIKFSSIDTIYSIKFLYINEPQ
jgi:hypothetical protein